MHIIKVNYTLLGTLPPLSMVTHAVYFPLAQTVSRDGGLSRASSLPGSLHGTPSLHFIILTSEHAASPSLGRERKSFRVMCWLLNSLALNVTFSLRICWPEQGNGCLTCKATWFIVEQHLPLPYHPIRSLSEERVGCQAMWALSAVTEVPRKNRTHGPCQLSAYVLSYACDFKVKGSLVSHTLLLLGQRYGSADMGLGTLRGPREISRLISLA